MAEASRAFVASNVSVWLGVVAARVMRRCTSTVKMMATAMQAVMEKVLFARGGASQSLRVDRKGSGRNAQEVIDCIIRVQHLVEGKGAQEQRRR